MSTELSRLHLNNIEIRSDHFGTKVEVVSIRSTYKDYIKYETDKCSKVRGHYLSNTLALYSFSLHFGEVMIECNNVCDDRFLIRKFHVNI